MSRPRRDAIAAWGTVVEQLADVLLERQARSETDFALAHRQAYLQRLGRLPTSGADVEARRGFGKTSHRGLREESSRRGPLDVPRDVDDALNVAEWAREVSRALVSGVAILSRCRLLAAPPIADWLMLQADPLWRDLLGLALGLVLDRPDLVEPSANLWSSSAGPLPGHIHAQLAPLTGLTETFHAGRRQLAGLPEERLDEDDSWFITHFFERLLAASDPSGRQRRGVYYTPRAVVQRMVSDVDRLLRDEFHLRDGLADLSGWRKVFEETQRSHSGSNSHSPSPSPSPSFAWLPERETDLSFFHLLDPSAGSGAFLVEVIARMAARFPGDDTSSTPQANSAKVDNTLDRFLTRRLASLHGLECLLPACLVAQLNVAAKLAEVGFQFTESFPPLVQLRDTLAHPTAGDGCETASERCERCDRESHPALDGGAAAQPEIPRPFTIVLGNPPFSGISTNNSPWIRKLLRGTSPDDTSEASYFVVDGQPLREKKVWLNDDYVKFFRYGQWLLDQAGAGILAFVTNHGYLDNITFRGMRRALLDSFDRITIIDLHGNRKRHETTADGLPDHNLFGIAQGTAIGYFRRIPRHEPAARTPSSAERSGQERYCRYDVWGTETEKLAWLESPPWGSTSRSPHASPEATRPECPTAPDDQTTAVHRTSPSPPTYSFSHTAESADEGLPLGVSLHELMPWYNSVPVTARDHLVIAFTERELSDRLSLLSDPQLEDAELRRQIFARARSTRYPAGDTRSWKLPDARRRFMEIPDPSGLYRRCLYRPWDHRVIFWADWMIDWPRADFMNQWLGSGNWAMVARRQMLPAKPCNFIWAANQLVIDGVLRSDNRGNESLFPIYRLAPVTSRTTPSPPRRNTDAAAVTRADPSHDGSSLQASSQERVANFSLSHIRELSQRLGLHWLSVGQGDLLRDWGPDDIGYYLYGLFHAPPYQRRYAELLRSGFPRAVFPRERELLRDLHQLGRRLTHCHLSVGEPRPRASEHGAAIVSPGSLIHRKIAPRYPRWERGEVWVNAQQSIGQVEEDVWNFRAGAHQVAVKWLADRRGRDLSEGDEAEYHQVLAAIAETLSILRQLESLLGHPSVFRDEFA